MFAVRLVIVFDVIYTFPGNDSLVHLIAKMKRENKTRRINLWEIILINNLLWNFNQFLDHRFRIVFLSIFCLSRSCATALTHSNSINIWLISDIIRHLLGYLNAIEKCIAFDFYCVNAYNAECTQQTSQTINNFHKILNTW